VLRANRLQRLARPSGSLSIRPLMSPTGNQRKGDTQLISGLIDDPAEVVICTETDRGLFVGANGEVQRHAPNLNPEPEDHGHRWA
jgi:hypothetical protein